jgi:hypothetical protein
VVLDGCPEIFQSAASGAVGRHSRRKLSTQVSVDLRQHLVAKEI